MQSRNAKLHSVWEERPTLNFFLPSSKLRRPAFSNSCKALMILQRGFGRITIEWLGSKVRGSSESSRVRRRFWRKTGWTGVPLTIWFLSKNYLPILFQLFSGQRNMCHFNPCYNVRVKGRLSILQVRH